MENLILDALKATEKTRNRDFLNDLGKIPFGLRDFECFLDEYSKLLGITLDRFENPNQYVYVKNIHSPINKKFNNLTKIEVNAIYVNLLSNADIDNPISSIFKNLVETRKKTQDPYIRLTTKYIINFFYGYSCGLTNLKYQSPNLAKVVSEFYMNLPSSVLAWDTETFFTNNVEETTKYLESHGLQYSIEKVPVAFFIDKRSYIYFNGRNIVDHSGFPDELGNRCQGIW